MPAGSTYTPVLTHTLPSAATSYTFTTVPNIYDDLILITSLQYSSGGASNDKLSFNGDTGSNYSNTVFYATGSIFGSYRSSNVTNGSIIDDSTSTEFNVNEHHIIGYKGTSLYKTSIGQSAPPSSAVQTNVQCWRNTNAITSITITAGAGTFIAGSTFTLYGIKNA